MRKRKRQMLAGIKDAAKHGKLSEVQGTMCSSKPFRKNDKAPAMLNDKVSGKQKMRSGSKSPSGWYSRGMFA